MTCPLARSTSFAPTQRCVGEPSGPFSSDHRVTSVENTQVKAPKAVLKATANPIPVTS